MRISDWSSDVCSSDLLALPDLVWQAPLPISDVPEPPSFRCEDYFTRGAAPVPPEPEPDPLSPEPRRPLTLDEQDRLRREMVAQARRQRDRFAILDSAHPSDLRCIRSEEHTSEL